VGKPTRYTPLPDQAYDPRVTDLSRPLNMPGKTGPQAAYPYAGQSPTDSGSPATAAPSGWSNRNVTNTIPFTLVAGQTTRALPVNYKRTGLLIQNLDATATLNFSFANDLQNFGAAVQPGGSVLLDFTTAPDTLYLFSLANIQVLVMEFSRAGS
jgi:hypothetical protein